MGPPVKTGTNPASGGENMFVCVYAAGFTHGGLHLEELPCLMFGRSPFPLSPKFSPPRVVLEMLSKFTCFSLIHSSLKASAVSLSSKSGRGGQVPIELHVARLVPHLVVCYVPFSVLGKDLGRMCSSAWR